MSFSKQIGIGENHENSSFYRTLYKSIFVQGLGMLRTDNCDVQEFLCTVTCIKYLLLPYLYDKQQRQLILNHIESKCYHPYNLLPDNGRPFEVYVSILPIQFLLLTWGAAIGARKMDWLPSASGGRAAGNI